MTELCQVSFTFKSRCSDNFVVNYGFSFASLAMLVNVIFVDWLIKLLGQIVHHVSWLNFFIWFSNTFQSCLFLVHRSFLHLAAIVPSSRSDISRIDLIDIMFIENLFIIISSFFEKSFKSILKRVRLWCSTHPRSKDFLWNCWLENHVLSRLSLYHLSFEVCLILVSCMSSWIQTGIAGKTVAHIV